MFLESSARKTRCETDRFARNEAGGVMVLTLFFFVLMVMIGGMAVDLMRYENARTALQQTLDRSILAAASLRQVRTPEDVVEDYFDKAGLADQLKGVQSNPLVGSRMVYAEGETDVDTFFMHMMDVDYLTAVAAGRAVESVANIEISLVLDISGSMREGGKGTEQITKLRAAAKNFFAQVLADDGKSNKSTTSINVVPYAGQVNVGPRLFELLGGVRTHSNSSCLELAHEDYYVTGKPLAGRAQTAHFMKWAIAKDYMDWGWCPMNKTSIIVAQNDLTKLNKFIDDMRLHDGTGTMTGTKYGLMLLDPTMNSIFKTLANEGVLSQDFNDRPLAWASSVGSDVTKYLIVMTDGQITDQFRPKYTTFRDPDTDLFDNEKIKNGKDKNNKDILVDDPDKVDGTDHVAWNATVELDNQPADIRGGTLSSRATNLTRFYSQCTLAKQKDVIIYTIAFNAPAAAKLEMQTVRTPRQQARAERALLRGSERQCEGTGRRVPDHRPQHQATAADAMIRDWLRRRLGAARREDGTATVEFVLAAPLIIFTFLAAFEFGVYMVRYIMLDRALDMTVRDLRFGVIESPALEKLKTSICDNATMVTGCEESIRIQMFSVDTSTWNFPTEPVDCVDRGGKIDPPNEPKLGVENEVMLIRACATVDAIFPTTGLAARLDLDSQGGYYVSAASAFVNEP